MKKILKNAALLLLVAASVFVFSCKDGDSKPTVVANFTYEVDATNSLAVKFTNTSTGFVELSWNFGDGSSLSAETNPVHTFPAGGDYSVSLTATDKNGKDQAVATQTITISGGVTPGPFSADRLVGGAWRVKEGTNTVFVGPALGDASWWQVPSTYWNGGSNASEDWSCMKDDDFIFTGGSDNTAGTMEYKTNGTARNDAYMGDPAGCWDDAQIAASGNGAAFGSATHTYELIPDSASPSGRWIIKLTNGATGAAFIGFYKGFYGGENVSGSAPPNGGNATTQ